MGFQRNESGPRARWLAGLLLLVVAPAFAETVTIEKPKVYQHRDASGVRTFSDLKRIRGARFLGEYGRPTATASCRGYSPEMLEARGAQYDAYFAGHAQAYNLEPALVKAVARIESCFDVRAVSRVGAKGLMQLMPQTASDLGVTNSFEADKNISGGAMYLRAMLDRFNGNLSLALAAYNAGPAAVARYGGIPPYRETQDYVKRVTNQYNEYLRRARESAPQLTAASFTSAP
jgi:soluble lytic murein transglycosylase-like protein